MLVLLLMPVVYVVVQVRRGRFGVPAAVAASAWFGLSALVLVLLLGEALLADEGDPPSDDLQGRLPARIEIVRRDESCGSGGCARVYALRDVGGAPAGVVAGRLRATGLDGCRRSIWWPDLRRRCTSVSVIGDGVLVSVTFEGLP